MLVQVHPGPSTRTCQMMSNMHISNYVQSNVQSKILQKGYSSCVSCPNLSLCRSDDQTRPPSTTRGRTAVSPPSWASQWGAPSRRVRGLENVGRCNMYAFFIPQKNRSADMFASLAVIRYTAAALHPDTPHENDHSTLQVQRPSKTWSFTSLSIGVV